MKALGVGNIINFPFLSTPSEECLIRAFELLYSLKVLDINGKYILFAGELTDDIGSKLSEIPLDPKLGVILINSLKPEFACA